MFVEKLIDRESHTTLPRIWQWKLPAEPPNPKIGRPKKANTPAPFITPESKPESVQMNKAVKIKFNHLKRSPESRMKGITDEDLLWQAKYLAQAEWKKQQAATA